MAPTKMISCKFFAQGSCRNGDSCDFNHERNRSNQNHFGPVDSGFPAIHNLSLSPGTAAHLNVGGKSTSICKFFLQGLCNRGDMCQYAHPQEKVTSQQVDPRPGQQDKSSAQDISDYRARVICRFVSRPGGCQSKSCPYLHTMDSYKVEKGSSQDFQIKDTDGNTSFINPYKSQHDKQDQEPEDDFTRELLGALVTFDSFGHILKISFPTDFSLACIKGFAPGTNPKAILDILRGLGFNLEVDCIRILRHTALSETKAMVTVEDPLFAKELCARLKTQRLTLSAASVSISDRKTNCRKVYISWHRATKSTWVNFGNGEIADRVAQKFNEGRYKCLGYSVRSSTANKSLSRWGRCDSSYNPFAWTIILSDVPRDATVKDIQNAITSQNDKPRQIVLGSVSYQASDEEVGAKVRSHLEEHGPLESFFLAPTIKGKRVKATAWFQDEADARSACTLDEKPLDILKSGKLTIKLVQSAKIKVLTTVYLALKSRIDMEMKVWKERYLVLQEYTDPSQQFTTLKIKGDRVNDVAEVCKALDKILNGIILTAGENAIWGSALSSNGATYEKLQSIEKELHVVILRDKSKRQLQFYGSPDKFHQAVKKISDLLKEVSCMSYEIDLNPHQFFWTIRGGFKSIELALGKNVADFNVVSGRITINGTEQQYKTTLSIMNGNYVPEIRLISKDSSGMEGECSICFSEPDAPIQTLCKHIYCLECFAECCKHAASTSKDKFQVKCQGDAGTCSTIFALKELREHLSSFVFEKVLKSSFEEYIQRHPEAFNYCPTADCGYVYRCTATFSLKPPIQTCQNCFELICTYCHARHGDYTCAEYKEIASGGYESLKRLKEELNIKDCPKCKTPMEKTEGCNHMTCGGCRAHICWVCMAVFETQEPCYSHMRENHGGIGLGLENIMDW